MTLFWILTGALALAVAATLALAVMRGHRDTGPAEAFDLQVYRDQLDEIERDLVRGVIPADEAERLRTEVSRRILAADAAAGDDAVGEQPQRATWAVAALVIAGVMGGAYYTYLQIGAPGYPDLPLAERIAAAEAAREGRPSQADAEAGMPQTADPNVDPDYAELVQRLRGAVAERPDDVEGYVLLARSEAALGNYVAAYEAQGRILALRGQEATAKDYADYADMMILAAGGYVSPEAERALQAALTRDPQNGVARYYMGLMMAQSGRPDQAFRVWDVLLRQSTPDAPWVPPIRAQIEDIAFRGGIIDYQLPEARIAGPSAEDMANAQDMSPEDRMAMIEGMVASLSQRLAAEGGPAQDWARLITALSVLDRTNEARAIWEEAQDVFVGDPAGFAMIAGAAVDAGLAE